MKIRKYKNDDLVHINKMLNDYNWEPWDSDLYGKYYYVITEGEEIVLFGGMYLYDVKVFGRLGLILVNKTASKEQRTKAFEMFFKKIFSICAKKNVKGIEYASSNDFMVNRLVKDHGFEKHTSKNADMLHKSFNNNDLSFVNED